MIERLADWLDDVRAALGRAWLIVSGVHWLLLVSLTLSALLLYRAEAREAVLTRIVERQIRAAAQAPEGPLLEYRLRQVEKNLEAAVDRIEAQAARSSREREWVGTLLIANLFTMLGGIITFVVLQRMKRGGED